MSPQYPSFSTPTAMRDWLSIHRTLIEKEVQLAHATFQLASCAEGSAEEVAEKRTEVEALRLLADEVLVQALKSL